MKIDPDVVVSLSDFDDEVLQKELERRENIRNTWPKVFNTQVVLSETDEFREEIENAVLSDKEAEELMEKILVDVAIKITLNQDGTINREFV